MERIDCRETFDDAVLAAVRALSVGGVVAAPTETVYGLLTLWGNEAGCNRIYELKHRPESKLLQMLADDLDSAARAGLIVCPRLRALADAFWPGALTVVADASDGSTIGLRIPDHPLLHALLPLLDGPLAATSANRSGDAAATTAESAVLGLEGLPDLLVDGGPVVGTGQPSTVVSICGGDLVVLRPGPIGETALRQAMG